MRMLHAFACSLAVIGVGLAAVDTASAAGPNDTYGNTEPILPSVTVLNQKPKNDAVSITYAYLPQQGRLVIFSGDPSQKRGSTAIGTTALAAGDHRDFKVSLSGAPKAGTRLWAAVEQAKSEKPFTGSDERAEQSFKVM